MQTASGPALMASAAKLSSSAPTMSEMSRNSGMTSRIRPIETLDTELKQYHVRTPLHRTRPTRPGAKLKNQVKSASMTNAIQSTSG